RRRPPTISTLFPYTTLFRSAVDIDYVGRRKRIVGVLIRGEGLRDLAQIAVTFHRPAWTIEEIAERNAQDREQHPGEEPFQELNRSEEHTSELQSRENLVCRL